MLWQHCVNVVAMLVPNIGERHWNDVQAVLCEHCGNVAPQVGDQHWENILYQCWSPPLYQLCCPILYLVISGLEWQWHKKLNVRHIATSASIYTVGHSHLQPFLSDIASHSSWVDTKVMNLKVKSTVNPHSFAWMQAVHPTHSSTGFECKLSIFKITTSSFLNNYVFSPNFQCTNAETTFRQCCGNVGPQCCRPTMMETNIGTTFRQHWSPMLHQRWSPMLIPNLVPALAPTLYQCWPAILYQCWPPMLYLHWSQCCTNIGPQCCTNVDPQRCTNIGPQCCTNVVLRSKMTVT